MVRMLLVIITIHYSLFTMAQISVEAQIDSIQILVGQQAHVTLTAIAKENAKVEFPQFQPTQMITPGVEVLSCTPLEDQAKDNGFVSRQMVYTLTSFDDTLYYLPPMTVKIDGKAYKSKSLALKVLTFEVDTTNVDQFFGPKDVQDNPFLWSDWSSAFWLSVLLLVLLAVTYYLYLRMRDNKPIITHIRIVKRLLPHQKAMQQIEQIKAEKMVTSEDAKLTAEQDESALSELRHLFLTADLVKFAKYSTLINENDANLVNAIEFINQTKLENQPVEEQVKPELSEEDQRSQKARRILKTVITVISVVSLLLFVYVVYSLYLLLI